MEINSPTTLLIIFSSASLLYLLCVFILNPMFIFFRLGKSSKIPVLPYIPFIGNFVEFERLKAQALLKDMDFPSDHDILPRLLPFHHKMVSRYGKHFVFWISKTPAMAVTDPDDVKFILSTKFRRFQKSDFLATLRERISGGGLFASDGDDWQNQRHILTPAFNTDKLKAMVTHMCAGAQEMLQFWEKTVEAQGGSGEIDVAPEFQRVTADVLARSCFGSSYEKGKSVFERQLLLLQLSLSDTIAHELVPGYKFMPTPKNLRCWKLEKTIERDLIGIVENRRNFVKKQGATAFSYGTDLLGLTLSSSDDDVDSHSHLTTQQVVDECKTFFFAGHEPTAKLLAWTMLLLALYPEWQETLRREALDVCGKRDDPKASDLNKLRHMGMVINESLRLYPPVFTIGRKVASSMGENLSRVWLPPKTILFINALALHKDPDLWGEDASEFKPERFREGLSKACKDPHGFLPFGMGPRNCIGQAFAMMEAKVVLVKILQRFGMSLSPNYRHAPVVSGTLTPKHGMPLVLHSL